MLIYLLKANIVLVLFYLAYRFGLRRLTFYTLNRFFLVGGIVCATVAPLIDPSVFIREHHELNAVAEAYIPDLSALGQHPAEPFINRLVVYVFWIGVMVMTIRLVIQLLSLWKLHRQTRKTLYDDKSLRIMEKEANPFSFMRNIYINPSLHTPEEFSSIIEHEKVHVQQWHTLDVLLGELNKIFYWFNPGAWLMSIAIRENLEFITDRSILRQGIDAKAYQYSLLKVSGIPYATAIANNFNFSHLKQRIMMMNKKRSSSYHLMRYVALGGIMGIAVLSLNFTSAIAKAETSARTLAAVFQADTLQPVPPPPPPPPAPPVPPPPPPPVKGKVKAAKPAPPAPPAVPAPAAAPAATSIPAPLTVNESPVSGETVMVKAQSDEQQDHPKIVLRSATGATPLYVIDDVPYGHTLPANLSPENISSIHVFKGESATGIYGTAGANGVIKVYTKGYQNEPNVQFVDNIKAKDNLTAAPAKLTEVKTDAKSQASANPDIVTRIEGDGVATYINEDGSKQLSGKRKQSRKAEKLTEVSSTNTDTKNQSSTGTR